MLRAWYENWINGWENRLCFRSTDRVVRPFEWGLEWTDRWPVVSHAAGDRNDPETFLRDLNRLILDNSEHFFTYEKPSGYRLENNWVRFRSPIVTPHPANDLVHAMWFPTKQRTKKAVVVLPHWNSTMPQHVGLCKGIAKFGIAALRLSLPYHDFRMPAELHRADYAVSSNVARTMDATRQAVADIRGCVDWLLEQGYEDIGIVGTSLGSCYAFLASTFDPRIKVNVFNHCSSYVADVVWTGLSTIHVRKGLEEHLDRDRLRALWGAISPMNYLQQFAAHSHKKSLFIYTQYDTTFLPEFSKEIVSAIRAHQIPCKVVALPCGHYTMGESPFKFIDGYQIISFLKRNL